MTYQYHTFPNGIRLVYKQSKGPVAHLGVVVNAGSRDEEKQQQGLAHFIEHMIFKGTAKRSNYQVLGRLENVGADLNAFTTREDTSIYASIQKNYLERAAELLADILFHSTFPEKEIIKEKAVVLDELGSYKDNPADWIQDVFDEMAFKDHALGRNILGTKPLLQKYTREDIIAFYNAHYTPARMVVSCLAGMPFSRVIAKLEPYFATHQVTGKSPGRQPFTGYTPFDSTRKYAKHQAHVIMGNMAFSAYQQQRIPMALLNNILGGPAMNSRLNLTLREKNGIAYNLESNYQAFTDSGLFTIYCGTDDTLLPRAVELIHRELRSLRESGLSRIKLHTAQRQLRGQLAISMQSQQHEMLAMGKNVLVYNKVDTLAEIYCKIDAITASDILEVASQVFNPAGLSMLTFTSK